MSALLEPRPAAPVANPGVPAAYASPRPLAPIDLWLAGNEGRAPERLSVRVSGSDLGRYPSSASLAARFAKRIDTDPERILVTAGADDALLRIALGYLAPGRELVLPTPTFEMIPRYAALAGGDVVEVPWPAGASYPTDAVLAAVTERTSVIAIVSPNNPTGSVATSDDVRRIARSAPGALIVVDQAYAEFADEDLAAATLAEPNAVLLRTLSKAYGCAGLRVGFAVAEPPVIDVLRAAGNPYPVAAPSLQAAEERLGTDITRFVNRVALERDGLRKALRAGGLSTAPGEGNFVFARTPRAALLRDLVAGLGIAIRAFPDTAGLEDALRITCPGDSAAFDRLIRAVDCALRPDTLLFDMDGVLADVSRSYRTAIIETARSFGVELTDRDIDAEKAKGGANDDWSLTQRLIAAGGVAVNLDTVTARFESLYQGTDDTPGLWTTETFLLDRRVLVELGSRYSLGIVTGRPRADAMRFLRQFDIGDLFGTVVTREDAALKPDPAPTRLALQNLCGERAWLFGDTPDDVRSARAAGVLPVGVLAPGGEPAARAERRDALARSGAGVTLDRIRDLSTLLP